MQCSNFKPYKWKYISTLWPLQFIEEIKTVGLNEENALNSLIYGIQNF
jgi:hypothetical protein